MLKKLFIIGVFTGIGQIFSLFALKYLFANSSLEDNTELAQIDSYFQLSLSLIALGLQAGAMREIALAPNWQEHFRKVQKARITFSWFLFPIGIAGFFNPAFYIFFLAPIFALSGDYALYATGKPVMGSIVSLVRTVLPYLMIILSIPLANGRISYWYLAGILFAYILTNWFIAKQLKMKLFFSPGIPSLQEYVKTIPLGIVNLCLYTIGLGLLVIVPGFYSDNVLATAFVGLKFYVLTKGVLRLIHQAYLREMQSDEICLRADQLSLLFTSTIAAAFLIFPVSTISFLFGKQFLEHKTFFLLLGLAAVVYAFNLSMSTRALLNRKDKGYTQLTVSAAGATIASTILLSFSYPTVLSIGISILLGEMIFGFGLQLMMGDRNLLKPRIQFLLYLALSLVPLYIIRLFLNDSLLLNIISLSSFLILAVYINRRRFISAIQPLS